jgi:hypothetical protein
MGKELNLNYETLVKLYLRLKGYLVSNLIIHSEIHGNNASELDIIAIRMPLHNQNFRKVQIEDYMESSNDSIEILIADVKNVNSLKKAKFNNGLKDNFKSIEQLIGWIGITNIENKLFIDKFYKYLNLSVDDLNGFATFHENTTFGKFTFKFTIFCPNLDKWNGSGYKYIHGEEIINFIWECLNNQKEIESCSRNYNYENWDEYEKYVRFFKNSLTKPTIIDFEKEFNI